MKFVFMMLKYILHQFWNKKKRKIMDKKLSTIEFTLILERIKHILISSFYELVPFDSFKNEQVYRLVLLRTKLPTSNI